MTIEHLANQSGTGNSLEPEVIAEIGNLTLINDAMQEELGVKHVAEKVKILQREGWWVDSGLKSGSAAWNADTIRARTDILCEVAYRDVWKI